MAEKLLFLSAVLLVLLCSSLVVSVEAASMWSQTYGGSASDSARSLIKSSDGGYVLAGTWNYSYSEDAWLVKTDPLGNMLWNKTCGGTEQDGASSLIITSDGNYAMAGHTGSYGAGGSDFWLVKIDGFGNIDWNRTYGGKDDDYASSLIATPDGGYALAGTWNYTTYYPGGVPFPVLHGDFWLVKTDASGVMQWNKTYGGNGDDGAVSLVVTSDGGYALTGYTRSFGAGSNDFWLMKTDAVGIMRWNKTYGGTSADFAYSLIETSDGGYAVVGTTMSFGAGGADFWLVKTDAFGNVQWNRTYGGTDNDMATSVIASSDGGYVLAGQTRSFGAGSSDFWLVKTDALGNIQWNKTYGGTTDDAAISLVAASDGGFAIVGNTWSFGVGGDFWLVKTDEVGMVPEFSSWIVPTLVLAATATVLLNKKKILSHSRQRAQ